MAYAIGAALYRLNRPRQSTCSLAITFSRGTALGAEVSLLRDSCLLRIRPRLPERIPSMNFATETALRLRSVIAVVLIALMLAACNQGARQPKFQTNDVTGADWGRDFHLIDQDMVPRSMADYE